VENELSTTVLATDPGKAALGIAAVHIALHHLFDDRSKRPILFLKTALILRQKPVKVMEEHPVERGQNNSTQEV